MFRDGQLKLAVSGRVVCVCGCAVVRFGDGQQPAEVVIVVCGCAVKLKLCYDVAVAVVRVIVCAEERAATLVREGVKSVVGRTLMLTA